VVTHRSDFKRASQDPEEFFSSLVERSISFAHAMRGAERVRPWWLEGDYSYRIDRLVGPGWLVIGDALRFIDPIFSTGVDVAAYSALFAFEAVEHVLSGGDESAAWGLYEKRVSDGVDVWYQFTSLFYRLQNLFTLFAVRDRYREQVVRILQGNPYLPESLDRARGMISLMQRSYEQVMRQPANLLRPGALSPPPNHRHPMRSTRPDVPDAMTAPGPASAAVDALVASVLGPTGVSDPAWRAAAYERAGAIARGAAEEQVRAIGSLPDLLAQLVDDVARAADRITDEHFEALYAAGYSAQVLYEMVVATAVGAGVERRTIGMEVIDAWEAAAGGRRGFSR
jgi:hypothetical protein